MKHYTYLFLAFLFVFNSCVPSEKEDMMNQFVKLQEYVVKPTYDSIVPLMDKESVSLYKAITHPDNQSIQESIEIGKKYNLPYVATLYQAAIGHRMKERQDPSLFFTFLSMEGVSFFAFDKLFKLIPKECRVGSENYVAIYHVKEGQNVMSWVRFTKEEGFRYDLIYTLRLYEMQLKKLHEEFIKDKTEEGINRNLLKVFATLERTSFNEKAISDHESLRRSLYESTDK